MRIRVHLKIQMPILRFVPEGSLHGIEQAGEEDLLRVDRNRARFDLRQIEYVGDQIQQVGPCAMNRTGEFHLLRLQVAVGVIAELLPKDQDTVEWRPQLMRHVGQEFGFVLRRQRQFLRFFLQRAACLFNLLVFALDLDVLFSKLLSFLCQLLVGLLQLLLLHLEFSRQLLRLLQQSFRLHGCFNAVQHNADAGSQLFQKRQLRRREGAQ